MKKLYKILSKQEFTSLYRFGRIPAQYSNFIDADCDINLIEKSLLSEFMNIPFFDGDEQYLIIKLNFADEDTNSNIIVMEDVKEIIPLTEAAKKSYELKFDPRISFSNPKFEHIIYEVEKEIDISDKLEGAKSLVNMLMPDNDVVDTIDNTILKKAHDFRSNGKKSSEIQDDFFIHLLVYERYEFFPNTVLGYIYDVGEIFAHSKNKPTFKGSGLHKYLEYNKPNFNNLQLSKLIDILESSDKIESFKNQLIKDDLRQYISALLFLKFKDELLDKDSLNETVIEEIRDFIIEKKDYSRELVVALYLTGGFFGFKKFYSDYYEYLNLPIFKSVGVHYEDNKDKDYEIAELKPKVPKKIENTPSNKTKPESKNSEVQLESSDSLSKKVIHDDRAVNSDIQTENDNIRKQLLEEIKNLINKTNNKELIIEKENLIELKRILKPLSGSKKLTKDKIIDLIAKEFSDHIEIPKKYTIKMSDNTIKFPNNS